MAAGTRRRQPTSLLRELGFWKEQARILNAVVIREIYTRFGRENIGFAWFVVEPMLFCLAVVALWSLAMPKEDHLEIPIAEFVITGYIPLTLYRHAISRLIRCMHVNGELLYHRSITIFVMYIARIFIEVIGAATAFVIIIGCFYLWDLVELPQNVPMLLAGFGIYAFFAGSSAIMIGALSERSEVVEKLWPPLSYVTIPFSGTFYMLYWLPEEAARILAYVPMTTGVEMIRGGYFGPGVTVYYHWDVALAASLAILAFGLWMLRDARKYVEIL